MSCLSPTWFLHSVTELTPSRLEQWGITALLLDADCTLKRYTQEEPEGDVLRWLTQMKESGIGLALVSNGLPPRIGRLAARLGLPFTAKAMKPFPQGVRRSMAENRFLPSETAMVGDQIFADILAGNIAGIRTVLVDPIHPEEEHWFTRLKRPLESLVKVGLRYAD